MAIPRNEQETVLTWDKSTKTWTFYTSDPVHMNKWSKHLKNIEEMMEDGSVASITGIVKGGVSVRGERVMSEEQKAANSERMKALHKKKVAEA